ncbi:capsular polysaccharide export protein, LipB/KpsS family [Methyloradius palustris]|uniref:Capsule polysaccharide biosynthesis protein n=1 Tax=Methyloradius palustris TaxID=2778876 RepID=A0A8D5FY90_9PROT|nr:hypothetical protein [Methyloradius palustris]BCM24242.1 hypothetical protein ZMTM_05010 [Methyloradius palustris]
MRTNVLYFVITEVFSPFFLNISRALEQNYAYKPYLVSFLPTDHAFLKKNSQHIYPKSLDEIENQVIDDHIYSDTEILEMCSFIKNKFGGDLKDWRIRLLKITAYVIRLIEEKEINLIVMWNGQDFVARTISEIARKRNIKCIYMENGYFPGTLQADTEGVNSAASVAKLDFDEIKEIQNTAASAVSNDLKVELIRSTPLTKSELVPNSLRRILNPNFYKTYPELRGSSLLWGKFLNERRKRIPFDQIELPQQFAFIPLQVHDDTQILLNSPLFDNPKDFIIHCYTAIREALGSDYPIVVKEHPEDIFRYSYDDIRQKFPDIIWIKNFPIDDIVSKSTFIMVVNSSVGLQAIKLLKPTIVFGESIYSKPEICYYISDKSETKEKILKAVSRMDDEMESNIKLYINFIENKFFFRGSWKLLSHDNLVSCINKIHNLSL